MRLSYAILTLLLVLLISGCKSYELESDWKDREITIDGDDDEWDESRYIIEKENIVVGVMNDEEFLYLCIYPSDRQMTQKIMRQGLTIWLNAESKKKKNYGIRFPLQGARHDITQNSQSNHSLRKDNDLMSLFSDELEIIGPDENEIGRYSVHELDGLELGMKINKGVLVYEIKIPCDYYPAYSFALDADPGSEIAVGFEIGKIEIDRSEMKSDESEHSGSIPGGGRGSGGRGSGRRKHSSSIDLDTSAQELWFKIILSEI